MNFSTPKRIFIVDDDIMTSEALMDYLTREVPHNVTVFNTGEKCLAKLDEIPEVIILDYFLDSVDKHAANGMEILKKIKKILPRVQVIMLSSQERYGLAMQTIQKGAEQYVVKGEDSFEKIERIINSY